jgi:hypothetical protein
MSDLFALPDGPWPVFVVATERKGLVDQLACDGQSIAARIEALEAGAPWGPDETGDTVRKNYTAEGNNELLKDALRSGAANLGELSDAITSAMDRYLATDYDNSDHISGVIHP